MFQRQTQTKSSTSLQYILSVDFGSFLPVSLLTVEVPHAKLPGYIHIQNYPPHFLKPIIQLCISSAQSVSAAAPQSC